MMKKIAVLIVSALTIWSTFLNSDSLYMSESKNGFAYSKEEDCLTTRINRKKLSTCNDNNCLYISDCLSSFVLPTRTDTTTYICTPNGTNVEVLCRDELDPYLQLSSIFFLKSTTKKLYHR